MEAEYNHPYPATWECKYHVVVTPNYRKKLLFGTSSDTWAKHFTIWRDEGVPDRAEALDA